MDSRGLGGHTVHRYDQELEALRARLLQLGGLVEQQLADALSAVEEQDGERAARVVSGDEQVDAVPSGRHSVFVEQLEQVGPDGEDVEWVHGAILPNRLEVEIDGACASLLARRAPVAADLRLVIGMIKTVNDLERIGDEAVRIARMAMNMSARSGNARSGDLRHLGPRVQDMLRAALDAFARTDPEAAVRVVEADRDVDREYESLSREMITFMMEDSRLIPRGLDLQFAARALERIGDRSCNIGEYVIYIVKGADVRHSPLEEKRSTAHEQ